MLESHNINNIEGASLESALKSDFGLDIKNIEKVIRGYSSQVYKADLEGFPVFIRMNNDSMIFEVEKIGYALFEEKEIPVPKIIVYKDNPPLIKVPTVIMTSAEGINLAESHIPKEDKVLIYKEVGEILKKIHSTKLEGFGPLKVENNELRGKFLTWKEYSYWQDIKNLEALDYSFKNKFITDQEVIIIKQIYKDITALDFGKASLLHKDMHHGHIFIKGTEVTGIIDLGALMAGDPRFDIAMSLVFINDREQEESLQKGYGELAYDPFVYKHLVSIVIRKIFFRGKHDLKSNNEMLLKLLNDSLQKVYQSNKI